LPEQRPFQLTGTLNLPERIAAVLDTVELIHGPDLSQARQFSPIQQG
jgi:predicted RNA polymerase sigma factor